MVLRKRHFSSTLVAVLLTLTLLMGCVGTAVASGGAGVLTVALQSEIGGLDPLISVDRYGANVYTNIYETLMVVEDGNIVPGRILESLEQPDNVTYVFKLKPGILFHNGEELNANDVAFSLSRGIGTKMNYLVGEIDPGSFELLDDYTLSLKLKAPSGPFIANLTTAQTGILNEKAVTEAGDSYQMHPIGTGPFKFVNWTKGVSCTLERNDDYQGQLPQFQQLVFKTLPEETTRTIELESGGVNIATAISPIDIERVRESEEFQLLESPTRGLKWVGFNTLKEPFNNPKVRQAIALAIDTVGITNSVKLGYSVPAGSVLNPNVMFHNPEVPVNEFDVEKAKALLAEAGYPDGFTSAILCDERTEMQNAATIIKSQLSKIGIEANIEVLEWAAFLNKLFDGEQEIFLQSWNCSTPDADNQFYTTFHSSMAGSPGNHIHLNDPQVDAWLDAARQSTDPAERQDLYYQLQQYVFNEKYWVPMWYDVDYMGYDQTVSQVHLDPGGMHHWWKTDLTQGN